MKLFFALILLGIATLTQTVQAQQEPVDNIRPATRSVDVNRIIKAFSAKETEFRQALNNYAFRRDASVQQIGMGGQVVGEYRRVSNFVFDDRANRFEKITYFPASTLTELQITAEDIEDLGGVPITP